MRKSILYSQNFLKNEGLVAKLVERSSISKDDFVYEIGAGSGIITEELLKKAGKVTAFEVDENLFNKLSARFKNNENLILRQVNFLEQPLPNQSYKVFSNIPFNITASIIKKLTQTNNPPQDTYLIIQTEAAKKFVGKPLDFKNSQISVLLRPWFELDVVHKFQKDDFIPKPSVDVVLLRIKKRDNELMDGKNKQLYEDFVVYAFGQFKPNITEGLSNIFNLQIMRRLAKELNFSTKAKPSELEFEMWLRLFDNFLNNVSKDKQNFVRGSFANSKRHEQKLEKINRTRVGRDWKSFRSKT